MAQTARKRRKVPKVSAVFGKPRRPRKAKPKLTAKQRIDRDPLYNPLATLTGSQLKKAAQQVTNAQYGPALAGLKRQLASTTTQGSALADRTADYYRNMAAEEAKSVARQQAIGTLAQSQIGAASKTAQDALSAAAAQAQEHVAADEAVRGKGLQGGKETAAADELRHIAGVDAGAGQSAAGLAALSSQGWAGLQDAMRSARVSRGGEEQTRLLTRLANQQQEIRARQADTEAAKGGEFVKQLLGLRQQGFENEATRQGLNLKDLDLRLTAAERAAARRQSAKDKAAQRQVTREGHDVTRTNAQVSAQIRRDALNERIRHDKQAEKIAARNRAKGVKEPASALAIRKGVGATTGYITAVLTYPGQANLTRKQVAQKVKEYVARHKLGALPDYVLTPALDLRLDGHLSPRTIEILRGYGVDVDALAPYAHKPKPGRRT